MDNYDLLKIEEKEQIETVDARGLHEFLEAKTRFNDWIRQRIGKYQFVEGQDFIAITERKVTAQGNISEYTNYHISTDMAKELSMVENNEKGREARQYFINCERKLKENKIPSDPQLLMARALIEANNVIENNNKQIAEMKPKSDFYDTVIKSPKTVKMGDVAKLLGIKGYGRNNLFAFLKTKGVLMRDSKPYQRFVDSGHFKINEYMYVNEYGETVPGFTTVVYQKGIEYIRKLIEKEEE